MYVNKDFDIEMYFIGIKIILPGPMGQKISGCEMTGFDTVGVAVCKCYLGPDGAIVSKPEEHRRYTADVGCKLFRAGTVLQK